MHRIDTATAVNNEFVDPNLTATPPVVGTIVDSAWFNSVQEELAGAVEGAGLTLSKADNGQLLKAINALIAASVAAALAKITTEYAVVKTSVAASSVPAGTLGIALEGNFNVYASDGTNWVLHHSYD